MSKKLLVGYARATGWRNVDLETCPPMFHIGAQSSLFTSFNFTAHIAYGCWHIRNFSSVLMIQRHQNGTWNTLNTLRATQTLNSSKGKHQKLTKTFFHDSSIIPLDSVLKETSKSSLTSCPSKAKIVHWSLIIWAWSRETPLLTREINLSALMYCMSLWWWCIVVKEASLVIRRVAA